MKETSQKPMRAIFGPLKNTVVFLFIKRDKPICSSPSKITSKMKKIKIKIKQNKKEKAIFTLHMTMKAFVLRQDLVPLS